MIENDWTVLINLKMGYQQLLQLRYRVDRGVMAMNKYTSPFPMLKNGSYAIQYCFISYPGHSLEGSLTTQYKYSRRILQVQPLLVGSLEANQFKLYLRYYVHFWNKTHEKHINSLIPGPVSCGCRIHRLHLCTGARLPQRVSYKWHKTISKSGSSNAGALGNVEW